MINKILLSIGALVFASSAFATLSCPSQVTIHCPANTQVECTVTSAVPSPWTVFNVYTQPAQPKAFDMTLPLYHVTFIANDTGFASCTYGSTLQVGTVANIHVENTSAHPILSPQTRWASTGTATTYPTYDCPDTASTYTQIDPSVCPFQGG